MTKKQNKPKALTWNGIPIMFDADYDDDSRFILIKKRKKYNKLVKDSFDNFEVIIHRSAKIGMNK